MKTIEECVPKTIEERALASWNERYPEGSERYRDAQIDGYIAGATEQKAIDHSEEHLAWITQEFLKWRESNNPKVSFGEWINVSMEE